MCYQCRASFLISTRIVRHIFSRQLIGIRARMLRNRSGDSLPKRLAGANVTLTATRSQCRHGGETINYFDMSESVSA